MMGRMLWLLASLASVASLVDGSPMKVMSAPNMLRVGTTESVFVECQDCTGGDIQVQIKVMNHPTKTTELVTTTVTLSSTNYFQALGQIKIPPEGFSRDATMKQYVYLRAQFPDQLLEKVVLVSFQSGYIFIQTDKTIYTPSSKVLYRLFAVTPRMEPVEKDENNPHDSSIDIEIMTPEGNTLPVDSITPPKSGIYTGDYQLGQVVSYGVWKVVAKFQKTPQQSYTAEFEVKEYVLPGIEVKLMPVSSFFYVDSPDLTVNIKATYPFGEEVTGTAYVVFGVVLEGQKRSFPNALQRVPIENGAGEAKLKREHITQTLPNIIDLVGSSIFVAVSVLTESGSEMVEAEVRGIQIVTSPYTIHFKKTPKYFKPGMIFTVSIEVVNPDESPAQGVAVVVSPGDVRGLTAANGLAKLTINTEARASELRITAKTRDPRILPERQTSDTMVAVPYKTKSNSYIHIVVDRAELQLGDNLNVYLTLNRQSNQHTDITYLILSRGQLINHGRYKTRGQVLISLIVPITKEMLPSFRIIAYFHPNDNEVVSDSVWVDVKDSCMGSLKLEPSRPAASYEPRRTFGLKVSGDPGATVGLVAVDKGVYVLNNKHRLTQKKVWDIVEKYDTGCTPGGGKDGMNVFYDAGLLFESSTASGTPYRQELKCPAPSSRRRRQTTGEEEDYMSNSEISSRTHFSESWLWADINLPFCPQHTPNCATSSLMKNVPLRDSITTWQFTGISLSRTHGICVSEPLEVIVRKDFSIDLRMPYSAVRGEQLEIKAILHNYSPDLITVRVDLTETEDVCSAASKRRRYHQEVRVGPMTTRSVPFIIIPMKAGQFNIEVKAAVKDSSLNDGVVKMLHVVPEGVLIKSPQTIILDPIHKGAGGKQEEILNSKILVKDWIPNTPASTQISVTGSDVGPLVENAISGSSMGSLIQRPSGSGELNLAHMTLPVIATMYLDRTNQWETVGVQRRSEALQHIMTGFKNELAFRQKDGSFAAWHQIRSSTWLTAYVVKVFAMANNLVEMQQNVICDAVKFLILNTQHADGRFREVGRVIHSEMIGDVQGSDSDASMTAFCLIAMQESRQRCAGTVMNLPPSIDKAVAYLERRLSSLTNPYAVAMSSYALANQEKLNKEILYNFASPELSHWNVSKGHVYTLEATAYALLALVKAEAFEDARPVVKWFNEQQRDSGGYGSTQATMIVYQAVAEYWANAKEPEYDLNVEIHLPNGATRYKFNRNNHHTTRTSKFNDINQDVKVIATGTGKATLTMVSQYYALPTEKQSDCQKFNLSVELIPVKMDEDEKIYKLRIDILSNDKHQDATLSILDIGLLTGFIVNTNDLDLLARGRDRTIAKYEMNTALSERGSLVIYLDKVSHTRPEEISFRIHQVLKVGVLQPAAVSVYEYYDQTQCVKFYHPERKFGQLLRLCIDQECTCAEENCSMQKKGKISNDMRTGKICESTHTSGIDFVYKVRLEEFTDGLSNDIYTMRILEVTKEGSYDTDLLGKLRRFLSYPHCREALNLGKGKTYLIMGTSEDIYKDQSYQYVLGKRTWIEYWPTRAECQSDEHRPTCLGLEEMVTQYTLFGCQH